MQRQQEEAIKYIKSKQDEQRQVKVNFKDKNEFRPNLFFGHDLLGSLYLEEFSTGPFWSQILTGDHSSELIKLCEFSPEDKWTLLYRGSRDGFRSSNFHSKCNGKAPTLTILKARRTKYLFGGFTTVPWDSSGGYRCDPNAFLFSLTNREKQPLKMKINQNQQSYAIECNGSYGPTFGDIYICNDADSLLGSFSSLGKIYAHPKYAFGTNNSKKFLSGSEHFQLSEIEVYQKE